MRMFAGFRSRWMMPCWCATAHADADVRAVGDGLLRRHRLFVGDLGAERMRRKILHRDRVAAADVQEVIDADDVLVRDAPRVAQLVHEALQHLLVGRDVGVQELQDQPLLDDGVLDENDGAERAFADLLDELVAALDHVAVLQGVQIERRRLGWRRLRDRVVGALDEQGARRRRRGRRAGAGQRAGQLSASCVARACVAARRRRCRGRSRPCRPRSPVPANRPLGDSRPSSFCSALVTARATVSSAPCALCCRWGRTASACCSPASCATAVIAATRTSFSGRCRYGSSLSRILWSPSLPTAAMATGKRTIVLGHHLEQRRQRFRVADLRQRVGGTLADPPVLVARRFDELVDGAFVAAGIQDLDCGAADVLVLVLDRARARRRRRAGRRCAQERRRRATAPTSLRRLRLRAGT